MKNEKFKKLIKGCRTILQVDLFIKIPKLLKITVNCKNYKVVEIESIDRPGHNFLLANTHFKKLLNSDADFLSLIQAIVSVKYLEQLKHELSQKAQKISVLFSGDFNGWPTADAFIYIFTQSVSLKMLAPG